MNKFWLAAFMIGVIIAVAYAIDATPKDALSLAFGVSLGFLIAEIETVLNKWSKRND